LIGGFASTYESTTVEDSGAPYLPGMSALPPPERSHAVQLAGVTRFFGRRRAVDGVDLKVGAGDCVALFGPNGAGKTTLLRLIAGLLKPTAGAVTVGGRSLRGDPSARALVGLISHQTMLYGALTARENVEFAARLYGVADARDAAQRSLERMQVAERADAPVKQLSRGLQQRVSIARSIVHAPSVVLLDEPYTGLDAIGGAALTEMLSGLRAAGATLVLVTHNIDEGLALASHVAIMIAGRIARRDDAVDLDPRAYAGVYRSLLLDGRAAVRPSPAMSAAI
jgi:heme exporter protein A